MIFKPQRCHFALFCFRQRCSGIYLDYREGNKALVSFLIFQCMRRAPGVSLNNLENCPQEIAAKHALFHCCNRLIYFHSWIITIHCHTWVFAVVVKRIYRIEAFGRPNIEKYGAHKLAASESIVGHVSSISEAEMIFSTNGYIRSICE